MAVSLTSFGRAILVASAMFMGVGPPQIAPAASGTCMTDRSAQALIAAHKIKTWPAIKVLAGVGDQYKEVSAVRVCEEDGQLYYVVNVAGQSGESKQLVINAVDGSR